MPFLSSILVVEDIARSRHLYETLLHLRVTADFGIYNVGFAGGLSLYRKAFFEELSGVSVSLERHNNVVLYFEVEALEALADEITQAGFTFIHPIRQQPWQQRIFRFYDYDNHILEIAEQMDTVLRRLRQEGHTIAEIAQLTGYPVEQVQRELAADDELDFTEYE
jgi:catechol 2,3-dioxygenase-like lactoylglutathione lyase family enzyme